MCSEILPSHLGLVLGPVLISREYGDPIPL